MRKSCRQIIVFRVLTMQLWSCWKKPSAKQDTRMKLSSAWTWLPQNSSGRENTTWISSLLMTRAVTSLPTSWLTSTRALWRIIQVSSRLSPFTHRCIRWQTAGQTVSRSCQIQLSHAVRKQSTSYRARQIYCAVVGITPLWTRREKKWKILTNQLLHT